MLEQSIDELTSVLQAVASELRILNAVTQHPEPVKNRIQDSPAVTMDDVRKAMRSLPKEKAKSILRNFEGATKLSELNESDYTLLLEQVNGVDQ